MLLASNYVLLGDFFTRSLVFFDGKPQVNVHRINNTFHDWYIKRLKKEYDVAIITKTKDHTLGFVQKNLKSLSELYNHPLEVYDLSFDRVIKYTITEDVKESKITLEKFVGSKLSKRLNNRGVSTDLVFDNFSCYPILPEDKFSEAINFDLFKELFPRFSPKQKIFVLTGEMIWSGWLTMDMLLSLFSKERFDNTLMVIDSWGLIQQLLITKNFIDSFEISDLNKVVENFSTSIELTSNKNKIKGKSQLKVGLANLYSNQSELFIETEHKPDFIFYSDGKLKSLLNKKVKPLGVDQISPIILPKAMITNATCNYKPHYGKQIQKFEGESVEYGEHLGAKFQFERKILKLHLPKQLKLKIKNGQKLMKGDVIATRVAFRNLMKENVLSPYDGFVNTDYFGVGIIEFLIPTGETENMSEFEGKILKLDKKGNKMEISALSYTLPIMYKMGKNVQGKLLRISEVHSYDGDKILLVKCDELYLITNEFIIQNSIVGLIIDSPGYKDIREYIIKILKRVRIPTICIMTAFTMKTEIEELDILYLYTGNYIIIEDYSAHLLINKTQSKEIIIRMKSRERQSNSDDVKKGDIIKILNYYVQDPYARIEKVSKHDMTISSQGELFNTNHSNYIKFKNIYYDPEK